jgi:hypothetical protein
MDIIGESVNEFFRELSPLIGWALNHWTVATVFLLGMIYWGKPRTASPQTSVLIPGDLSKTELARCAETSTTFALQF